MTIRQWVRSSSGVRPTHALKWTAKLVRDMPVVLARPVNVQRRPGCSCISFKARLIFVVRQGPQPAGGDVAPQDFNKHQMRQMIHRETSACTFFAESIVHAMGYSMISAYAASKGALRSMVRSLASELLPCGIWVNAVSPGPITIEILGKSLPQETVDRTKQVMRENNPMQRFGEVEEVAKVVAFLAFDASYTTGTEPPVDGGVSRV